VKHAWSCKRVCERCRTAIGWRRSPSAVLA
jgi:hypothetical protein